MNGYMISMWKGPIKVRYTMHEILDDISMMYGVSVSELRGPGRTKGIAHARQHAMYLMAKQAHLSLPQIGRYLNRDHTTILYGVRAHKARCEAPALSEEAA